MSNISRRIRRLRLDLSRRVRRAVSQSGSESSPKAIARYRFLVCEELESRRLLAAEITNSDDAELLQWHGKSVPVERGEWIVQFDGPSKNRGVFKLGPFMRSARTAYPTIANAIGKSISETGHYLFDFGETVPADLAMSVLASIPGLKRFEPNFIVTIDATPNDPSYPLLWGLNQATDVDIDAPEAWDVSTGSSSVVVGVIDTGIDYTHEDLRSNIWTNPVECPAGIGNCATDGIDNDSNGYIDDFHGWDFYNGDNDPFDDHSHGTHVAGTISAEGNNGKGITGVNWNAKVMPLKFIGAGGTGSTAGAIAAIQYATKMKRNHGINIVVTNNSWGGGGYSQALYDAINESRLEDMLFVAAAGNDATNNDVAPHYPSSYNLDNIIAVASTTSTDSLSSFSNTGVTSVDLGAPGSSIFSTTPAQGYGYKSGTSMAAPHVAGAAALAWSVDSTASYDKVRDAILTSVQPIPALQGVTTTGGRLNAFSTLENMGLFAQLISPAEDSIVEVAPTVFTLNFSDPIVQASVDPGDLKVNGISATSIAIVDSDTVNFQFTSSPVAIEGLQQVDLAAGSILRLEDNDGVAGLHRSFYFDPTPLQVSSITPTSGGVLTLPNPIVRLDFSEPIAAGSIGLTDLTLSSGRIARATVIDSNTVEYELDEIDNELPLSLSLSAGAVRDQFGVPNQSFNADYVVDNDLSEYPRELVAVPVLGSMIYQSTFTGNIHAPSDTDRFTLDLVAGQRISAILQPATVLAGRLKLRAPNGSDLFQVSGVSGSALLMQSQVIATSGPHTLVFEGDGATSGLYDLHLVLNGAIEHELVGTANNSQASSQNLDSASSAIGTNGSRLGLFGSLVDGTDVDWYQFSATAGEDTTLFAQSAAGAGLQVSLRDAGGLQVAAGSLFENAYYIHDFVPAGNATYFVRVAGVAGEYSLAVQRGVSFDNNANDTLGTAQELTGPTTLTGHVGRLSSSPTGSNQGEGAPTLIGIAMTELPNGLQVPSDMVEGATIRDIDGSTQINFARPQDPRDWIGVAQSNARIEQAETSFISINSDPEGDLVRDIAYTPDGSKYLIAYRESRNVIVYSAATNAILATIPVAGEPESLAITPDGSLAVTANTSGNSATVINLATWAVKDIPLAAQWPYRVRITPDGSHAVLATADQAFSLVSLSTLREVRNIVNPGLGIHQTLISFGKTFTIIFRYQDFLITPDGSSLITGAWENNQHSIRIHSLTSDSLPATVINVTGMIHGLTLSAVDGTKAYLSTANIAPGKIYELNLATKSIQRTLTTGEIWGLKMLPTRDGQYLMTGGVNTVLFIRISDGSTAASVGFGSVDDIALSFDGKHLLSRWVIDVASRTIAASLPLFPFLDIVATSPTEYRGVQASTSSFGDLALVNINGSSSSVLAMMTPGSAPEGDAPIDIAVTPDGLTAITANWHSDNVSIIDLTTNNVTAWIDVGEQPEYVAITPNGAYALVGSAADDSVSIIDLVTKAVVSTLTGFTADPRHILISADSTTAYVNTTGASNQLDRVYFVNLNGAASSVTGSLVVGDIANELVKFAKMALSPDGSLLAVTVSRDNQVVLINTASRTEVARLPTGALPMDAIFSPSGDQLYVLNWDGLSVTFVQVAGANSVVSGNLAGLSPTQVMALDEQGQYLYIGAYTVVQVIDTATQSLVHTVSIDSPADVFDMRLVDRQLYLIAGEPIPLNPPLLDNRGHLIRVFADGPNSRMIDDQLLPGYAEAVDYSSVTGSAYVSVTQDGVVVSNYDGDGNGDQDYYRFLPQFGDALSITGLVPAITGGQIGNELGIGLELYGPDDQLLVRSLSGTLNHTVTMLGEYKLRAFGQRFTEGEYILSVTGITEVEGPSVIDVSPQLGATFVALDAQLTITFDEPVVAGAGNISIRRYADNVEVGSFASTSQQVSVAGNVVTIMPGIVWDVATKHYVLVDTGAFEDASGNDFGGISDQSLWNFTFGYGIDFGDAPAPYFVTPAENGARHQQGVGPSLGANRDPEFAGVHSPLANSDDVTGTVDDEDGVTFSSVRVGQLGATATVQIHGAPDGARLDAWIDFNRDGLWGGMFEQIAFNRLVENGTNTIEFDVPAWSVDGTTYARFRVSSEGKLGTIGESLDGEVEDYALTILPPEASSDFFTGPNTVSSTSSFGRVIFAADLDSDGDNDLITTRGTNSLLAWYDNDGNGSFTERVMDSSLFSAYTLSAADVDGDGDVDVLVGALIGGVRWYENRGSLGFTRRVVDAAATAPSDIEGVDMDSDGDVDLLAIAQVNGVTSLVQYENLGDETFVKVLTVTDIGGVISAIDLDSDGDNDILTNDNAGISWYENNGGALTKRSVTSNHSYYLAAMDVDGDGDIDVLNAAYNQIAWYRNDGNQNFTGFTITVANQAYAVVGADLDGDGDTDVVSDPADDSDNLLWHENNGSQVFTTRVLSTQSPYNSTVLASDLDGDGDLDVVASSQGDNPIRWYQNQKGTTNLLELTLSARSMSENGGSLTGTIKRTATSDLSQPLVVNLSSSDISEATLPATVTIPSNSDSATFLVTSVDDQLLDGVQPLGINATATNFYNTSATLDVLDYETLSVAIAVETVGESAGTTTATVTRSNTGDLGTALVVALSSSDSTQATVPATVTIAAGQATSPPFTISVLNDSVLDGTYTAVITASSDGYLSGADTLDILDNESAPPSTIDLLAAFDSGFSSTDNITQRDNSAAGKTLQFSVSGTISGATVKLYSGTQLMGSVVASGTITSITTDGSTDLADGLHAIVARQTQPGGQESASSTALTVTVDTAAPATPSAPDLDNASDKGLSNSDNVTNDITPTINVAVGSNYFKVFRNGSLISGSWESGSSFTTSAQADGTLEFTMTTIDPAGNESAVSSPLAVTLDTVAPSAILSTISPDPRATSVSEATITFDETVGAFDHLSLSLTVESQTVALDAAQNPTTSNGTVWTIPNLSSKTIAGGTYELRVLDTRLTDVAGNLLAAAVSDTWFRVGPPVMPAEPFKTPGTSNTVSWNSVPGDVQYFVEYDTSETFPSPDGNSGWITGTSHTFNGLTSGQTYYYRVKSRLSFPSQSASWSQTSQSEFALGTLANVSTTSSPGDVQLSFGPDTVLFSENFEDGDFSGWDPGAGASVTRRVDTIGAAATTRSFTIVNGSDNFRGISRGLGSLTPDHVNFYVRPESKADIHSVVVLGNSQSNSDIAARFMMNDSGMGISSNAFHSVSYDADTWYKITLHFDWTNDRLDYYVDNQLRISNISFLGSNVDHLGRIYLYDHKDADQSWWDEISMTDPGQYVATGTITSPLINPSSNHGWQTLSFNRTTPANTSLTVDVLDANGVVLATNVANGASLSAIPLVPIKLRANLSTSQLSATPSLHDWSVSYISVPETYLISEYSNTVSSQQDATAPALESTVPVTAATNVAPSANLSMTFDESVQAGSGSIVVRRSSDSAIAVNVDVNSSAVTFSGNTVTIDPPATLDWQTQYYVQVSSGAIEDLAGNDYAGIGGFTTWRFTTVPQALVKISNVIVGSTTWTNAGFIDAVDGGGTGAGNGLGHSLVGSHQLRNLPWIAINKIYIQFTEDVSSSFSADDVALVGTNVPDYRPFANVQYGVDGPNLATITLTNPIANDAIILTVFDQVVSSSGSPLDGEWVNAVSSVSGDGTSGGQFNFRIDVLPGDVNDSGGVNFSGDALAVFDRIDMLPLTLAEAYFDVNSSGGVNFSGDALAIFDRIDWMLPAAPLPPIPPSGASEQSSFGGGFGKGNPAEVDAIMGLWREQPKILSGEKGSPVDGEDKVTDENDHLDDMADGLSYEYDNQFASDQLADIAINSGLSFQANETDSICNSLLVSAKTALLPNDLTNSED